MTKFFYSHFIYFSCFFHTHHFFPVSLINVSAFSLGSAVFIHHYVIILIIRNFFLIFPFIVDAFLLRNSPSTKFICVYFSLTSHYWLWRLPGHYPLKLFSPSTRLLFTCPSRASRRSLNRCRRCINIAPRDYTTHAAVNSPVMAVRASVSSTSVLVLPFKSVVQTVLCL